MIQNNKLPIEAHLYHFRELGLHSILRNELVRQQGLGDMGKNGVAHRSGRVFAAQIRGAHFALA